MHGKITYIQKSRCHFVVILSHSSNHSSAVLNSYERSYKMAVTNESHRYHVSYDIEGSCTVGNEVT